MEFNLSKHVEQHFNASPLGEEAFFIRLDHVMEFKKAIKNKIKDIEKRDSPAFKPLYEKLYKLIDKLLGDKI